MTAPRVSPLAALDGARLWARLHDAASGRASQPDRELAARELAARCAIGGTARLGWVCPPPWRTVERSLAPVLDALHVPARRRVLVLGTGGWSFAARALAQLAPSAEPGPVACLDSLDPAAIEQARRSAPGAYLAVSGSGGTLETRTLADLLPSLCPAPVIWLRDHGAPPHAYPLSPRGVADHVAMLGAPLSLAFLVPAALTDAGALADAYTRLSERYHDLALGAAERATQTEASGAPHVRIAAPAWAREGLRTWLLQLGRQVLCGKNPAYQPWVDVVRAPDPSCALDLTDAPASLAGLMEAMYRAGIFVACLALRAGLRPVEHANVAAYKRLLAAPETAAPFPARPIRMAPAGVPRFAADWLAGRPDLRRLHVVRYGGRPRLRATALSAALGLPCEVHTGSAWNHHSYQAVYSDAGTAVLVWAAPGTDGPLHTASRTLRRLAWASHASLGGRSALIETSGG